jgi:hypothetical protein
MAVGKSCESAELEIWRDAPGVSVGLDSRKYSAIWYIAIASG